MLEIMSQINKGIMFIRLEGELTKNNFYKLTETINYLLYKQGILVYVLNLSQLKKLDCNIIPSLQNKLTEIFLSCGSVAICGGSNQLKSKIGKRKEQLFYLQEEREVFNYINI